MSKSQRTLFDWVQLITTLSVLVGIGLVVFELRQNKDIAIADLISQQFAVGADLDSAILGENSVVSLAKSCRGERITVEDALILDEYFWGIFNKINQLLTTYNAIGNEWDWAQYAEQQLSIVFSYPHGLAWWEFARQEIGSTHVELVALGDRMLEESNWATCSEIVGLYQSVGAEK